MQFNYKIIARWNKKGSSSLMNCWGATLLFHHLTSSPCWMEQGYMGEMLNEHFEEISDCDFEEGDVVAFYGDVNNLLHTAIYFESQWWHKPGKRRAEFTSISEMILHYNHNYKFFRRKIFLHQVA